MILARTPISLADVKALTKNLDEKKPIVDYLRVFTKLTSEKARACADELRALQNPKLREEHIVKLVDFLPQDAEDLSKVCIDVSLTEEEMNALLTITTKY